MELRRAILLFAIVLVVVGIVGTLVQPSNTDTDRTATEGDRPADKPDSKDRDPSARPGRASSETVTIRFGDTARPKVKPLPLGQPAELVVEVDAAGEVAIPGLGLIQSAHPLTPARFFVLAEQPGRHNLTFDPASSAGAERIGVLKIEAR